MTKDKAMGIAKELLRSHREASPTCALMLTEKAIVKALLSTHEEGRKKGIEESAKLLESKVKKYSPTHGTCCTCQGCGLEHDSCICSENDIFIDSAKAILQLLEVKSEGDSELLGGKV